MVVERVRNMWPGTHHNCDRKQGQTLQAGCNLCPIPVVLTEGIAVNQQSSQSRKAPTCEAKDRYKQT